MCDCKFNWVRRLIVLKRRTDNIRFIQTELVNEFDDLMLESRVCKYFNPTDSSYSEILDIISYIMEKLNINVDTCSKRSRREAVLKRINAYQTIQGMRTTSISERTLPYGTC